MSIFIKCRGGSVDVFPHSFVEMRIKPDSIKRIEDYGASQCLVTLDSLTAIHNDADIPVGMKNDRYVLDMSIYELESLINQMEAQDKS